MSLKKQHGQKIRNPHVMPNAVLGSRSSSTPPPPPTLLEKVMRSVTRASPEKEVKLFVDEAHPHYGETRGSEFYVNEARLRKEGSTGDFVSDMQLGESLHRLRDTAPEWHSRLQKAAADDPAVQQWKRRSYDYVTGKAPDEKGRYIPKDQREERPIEQWWDVSRCDQVVGGFLLGGPNANLSTMRGWDREKLPFGTKFRRELENFEKALGRTPPPVRRAGETLGRMPRR